MQATQSNTEKQIERLLKENGGVIDGGHRMKKISKKELTELQNNV